MYYFYVLYSLKDGRLYKGSTGDVGQRLLSFSCPSTGPYGRGAGCGMATSHPQLIEHQ